MQTQSQPISPAKQNNLFISLLILTAFLVLAELSFLVECSGLYFGDFQLIASRLSVPIGVLPGVLIFIFTQLALHFLFTSIVWIVTKFSGLALHLTEKWIERFGISLWFVSLSSVLLANKIYYPNSKFSSFIFAMLSANVAKILLTLLSFILVPALLLAFFGIGLWIVRQQKIRAYTLASILVAMVSLFSYMETVYRVKPTTVDAATAEKPNIIIIGIDSVRPDFLGFFGYANITPHIDKFLNHATVFAESLTPLARTYPSWVSILTGVYPKLNTVRTNLADQSQLDLTDTLPAVLREEGYRTIFATDETRFSNIDKNYGFDEVVVPPIGVNDFLIGSLNDFPISNLLVNTSLGYYLFPHSYANRAVFATYDPNSFLKLLQPTLAKSRTQPTLLITHFCLPHYPYAWATLPIKKVTLHHYQAALRRSDKQFHDFMVMLQQNHLLQHSIVVLLSDHGEAVEIPGDRLTDPELFIAKNNKTIPHFYPPNSANEAVNMSGGHGTDVLGLPQYHTMLAFKTFGMKQQAIAKTVTGIVSVMDIKPTLLTLLDLPIGRSSGEPLQDYIFGNKTYIDTKKDFFVESDFSPEAVRSIHPEERKVLFEGINYFRIDHKTKRIVVRDSMLQMILSSKQFADYYGSWVLALYPQDNKTMMPILVDLRSGKWTNDLTTEFAQQSPADHMLSALKTFFGRDITAVKVN